MTNQQNIANTQQKFVIKIDSRTSHSINQFDKSELVKAYLQLFYGFSQFNWTNNHSLGRAWQTSINQCGAFCQTKNKNNPAAKFFNSTYNGHKKYWSQIIMTHQNRENTISTTDKDIKQMRQHAQHMIRQAIDKINLILARYNEYTLEIDNSPTQTMGTSTNTSGRVPQKNSTTTQSKQTIHQDRPETQHAAQMTTPLPSQQQKPYEKPEMSVRENQFAKTEHPTKTEPKTATFTTAQKQTKYKFNLFIFKKFNQRAA